MRSRQLVPGRQGQRSSAGLSASGIACLLLVMAAVAGAKVPKPSVTAFTVTPSSVATQNGWVTLSATVADASSCVFSAKPAVSGLPVAVPCSTGAVTEDVDLPPNTGKKAAKYSFHLSVAGAGGTRSAPAAKATVGVGAGGIPDELTVGSTLQPGAFLLSPDHEYELVMQTDGNLVLYNAAKEALWSSQTSGEGNYLVMQGEGNLVVYNPSKVAQWATGTWGFSGAYLQLQDDGNLVLYQDGHAIWTYGSGYKGDTMNPGEDLQPGAYLLSPDHEYELVMQTDGNLVLYNAAKEALWSSQTSGEGSYLVMQSDGNLVVYNATKVAQWNAGTGGNPGAYLEVQDDSNVVIYQGGTALWDWGSGRLTGEIEGQAIVAAAQAIQSQSYPQQPFSSAKYLYCFDGGTTTGASPGKADPEPEGSYANCNSIGRTGFDCRGFALYSVYQGTGGAVTLPTATAQAQYSGASSYGGSYISLSALQPGDLVFFGSSSSAIAHVGIVVSGTGTSANIISAINEEDGITTHTVHWFEAAFSWVGAVGVPGVGNTL
jgi:hypothetical protein